MSANTSCALSVSKLKPAPLSLSVKSDKRTIRS